MTTISPKDIRDVETLDVDETPPYSPEDCMEEISALLTHVCKPKFRRRAQKRFRILFQSYVRMAEDAVAHHMAKEMISRVRFAVFFSISTGFIIGYFTAQILVG